MKIVTQRKTDTTWFYFSVESKTQQMSRQNRSRPVYTENKLMAARGEGLGVEEKNRKKDGRTGYWQPWGFSTQGTLSFTREKW